MAIQHAVEQRFEASLVNPEEDPEKAYVELGKMLSNVRSDLVLSHLAGKGEEGIRGSKEEVTAEVFEDAAIRWALRRLSAAPGREEAVIVEEQVFRVLTRSLQATHTASRLAQKLAEFAKEYALPKHTQDRIQEEVRWLSLRTQQKLRELLSITHFSATEFRRMLGLIKDLLKQGKNDDVMALGFQYFSIFDDHLFIQIEEVGRIPELLRALSAIQGEFWGSAAACLNEALVSMKLNQLIHVQVVNSIVVLARIAATYEDFQLVHRMGVALEQSSARGSGGHSICCGAASGSLLQPSAVDRIAEIFLEQKNDASWVRLASAVLQWSSPEAMERLFIRLDNETAAANRLAFLRLMSRLGPSALRAARQRLTHPEWFIVRNACKLLGELKDPELLRYIAPALAHKDERVQKAAMRALIETRLPGAAAVLAGALSSISPLLFEEALSELIFQASPQCIPGVEQCFQTTSPGHEDRLKKLVTVIAAIRDVSAADLLARIIRDQKQGPAVRTAAQEALSLRHKRNLQRWLT
ncbi:MAG: HEAT repeat domain-containing protein, partial [Candidatus Angelobacter sp.]